MNSRPASVARHLYFAIFGVSAFVVVAAVVSLFSFWRVNAMLEGITGDSVPLAIASLDLSRQAERIVGAAPGLLTAAGPEEQAERYAALLRDLETPQGKLAKLTARIEAGELVASIARSVTQLRQTLDRVHEAGFRSVLTKPARSQQLLNALAAAFQIETAAPSKARAAAETLAPQALSILLVDDNKINRKVGCKILKRLGYEADLADGGQEAIDRCSVKRYDLVLMDIEMPEMDGVTAATAIRERASEGDRPFIVALTPTRWVPTAKAICGTAWTITSASPCARKGCRKSSPQRHPPALLAYRPVQRAHEVASRPADDPLPAAPLVLAHICLHDRLAAVNPCSSRSRSRTRFAV